MIGIGRFLIEKSKKLMELCLFYTRLPTFTLNSDTNRHYYLKKLATNIYNNKRNLCKLGKSEREVRIARFY